ncbi:glycosyltransferase [Delftia acidovorans]|uniref:glycosyltransferase n=1 Tax=Delftia acidovorans TaxID=80866 RepID=UPI00286F009D|nr:glycosyltransferase [Delftia acidovorans]
MRIKTVLIVSHMYPRINHPAGGIFVHEQAKALRDAGVDARVITGDPFWINTLNPLRIISALKHWWNLGNYEWDIQNGVPVINFPYIVSSRFLPFQVHALTYKIAAMRCMEKMQRKFSFQVIHAHTSFMDGTAGAALSKKYNVPFVLTEHTGPFRTLTRTSYLKNRTQRAINSAGCVIAVSQSLLKDIHEQVLVTVPEKAKILPNVVDVGRFAMVPQRTGKRGTRVLWVGHFVPIKRVDLLIRAFKKVAEVDPGIMLSLVGHGELETKLRSLVNELSLDERVEFLGNAARDELPKHYQNSDFLVISSESETFGVVAIEAMSCGIPVLCTDCGGPSEMISDQRLGLVVGMGLDDLAEGLLKMSRRQGTFDRIYIRNHAVENFSAPVIAEKMIDIYDDLTAKQ